VEFSKGGEFFCHEYPRHAHWKVEGDIVIIDWADLGTYEMKVDSCCGTMAGHYKGYPDDWRKGKLVGDLDHIHTHDEHAHSHEGGVCGEHKHDASCNH